MATRLRDSTDDRISNLPGDVIERVLVFLPIKAGSRSSILSRNWRYRWRSIPQLVFDDRFAPLDDEDGYLQDENKVVMKIYEALLAHDGLITKFELSITELRSDPPLDFLMLHLSGKGVQELTLLFGNYLGRVKLHSSLFSAAFPLKRLKLQRCEVGVPSRFVGFSKLTLLELEDVMLPGDFYENFLPRCPLLQELRVTDCSGGEQVFVAPSLKVFLFFTRVFGKSPSRIPHCSFIVVGSGQR